MESSRIFVKGLPPSLGEGDFRKHFSARNIITDAKLFPHRRIGYVGYKSHEDALMAVKYFNKTFINMSRIAVELARPAAETPTPKPYSRPLASYAGTGLEYQDTNPLKRKRDHPSHPTSDPRLTEYLSLAGNKQGGLAVQPIGTSTPAFEEGADVEEKEAKEASISQDESDDEYQQLAVREKHKASAPLRSKKVASQRRSPIEADNNKEAFDSHVETAQEDSIALDNVPQSNEIGAATDADWLRSRTSRLLGLLDEDEELDTQQRTAWPQTTDSEMEAGSVDHSRDAPVSTGPLLGASPAITTETENQDVTLSNAAHADAVAARHTRRLFLRNLSYEVSEDHLRQLFATYGDLEEIHVPIDKRSGKAKGLAYVQYQDGEAAVAALRGADGTTFQGRLLHVIPASAKRETKLDEFAISKLPLKTQKQIRKRAAAAASAFSWNSLYMNADAVISSVADRLGVDKSAVLDPTSSDAAVKQAVAETHVIQETKAYFTENGVDIEAFKRSRKGDTGILVKNFSYGTKADELRKLFEEHGQITRFLMPPSGTIAIVEFAQPPQARSAFAALAYRKLKDSVLFLEKAPPDLFTEAADTSTAPRAAKVSTSATDLMQETNSEELTDTTTLFVKNLNFTTSSSRLAEAFRPLDGFISAVVRTKTNPRKPQETLSMGFGFLEFKSKAQAQAALAAMDGYTLDGHQLVIKASQKGMDAAEERRREDRAKRLAAQKSKVIIKNLPFETTKKDVRALLRQYGQLRTVRVPKKFDSTARGFAFAEFTTTKEAAAAMEALRNTHLLGRKLVMEYAAEDPADAEEQLERMQQKVGQQTNKVVLQKMLGVGRQKFRASEGAEEQQDDE